MGNSQAMSGQKTFYSLLGISAAAFIGGSLAHGDTLGLPTGVYTAEVCAVSQIEQNGEGEGGANGHAVMWLKGACRDTRSAYPRIDMCATLGLDPAAAASGVGISVDQDFSNVNWVAVNDRDLFFNGGVPQGSPLEAPQLNAVYERAHELEIYKGVISHPSYIDDYLHQHSLKSIGMEDFLIKESVGTNYALNFGRTIYCSKIPVQEAMMKKMVDYLNGLNEKYFKSNDYQWNAIGDNCTHVPHNALAAAGIVDYRPVDQFILFQVFNLAVPADEFVDEGRLTNDLDLSDIWGAYTNNHVVHEVMDYNWIPTQPGAIVEVFNQHSYENTEFQKSPGLELIDFASWESFDHAFKRLTTDPRINVGPNDGAEKANLEWYRDRYKDALAKQVPLAALVRGRLYSNHQAFRDFYSRYYALIAADLADVEARLAKP
jgi:hypothetical protein